MKSFILEHRQNIIHHFIVPPDSIATHATLHPVDNQISQVFLTVILTTTIRGCNRPVLESVQNSVCIGVLPSLKYILSFLLT